MSLTCAFRAIDSFPFILYFVNLDFKMFSQHFLDMDMVKTFDQIKENICYLRSLRDS